MTVKRKSTQEAVYKMGWCSGVEVDKAHDECAYKTYSDMTKQEYICGCDCHEDEDTNS